MTLALGGRTSQLAALLVVPQTRQAAAEVHQLAGLVVYAPPSTRQARTSQAAALVPYEIGKFTVPRTSQLALLVVYTTGVPDQSRSRAWSFVLDGHTMYVLNLGEEGTFVYDTVTQQWCKFETWGYNQWNVIAGCMWGMGRIVGGDSVSSQVWEVDPTAVLDDGWRDIEHIVTGGIATRSRVYISCESLRVAASIGQLDQVNGATLTLRFSDDQGKTWSADYVVTLTQGDYKGEIAYRSLGSFMAPGRIFELSDIGGLIRIDGADLFADEFDDAAPKQGG